MIKMIRLRLKTGISVPPTPGFVTIAIGREHSGTIDRGFSLVESVQLPLAANYCHCFSSRTASDASTACLRPFYYIEQSKKSLYFQIYRKGSPPAGGHCMSRGRQSFICAAAAAVKLFKFPAILGRYLKIDAQKSNNKIILILRQGFKKIKIQWNFPLKGGGFSNGPIFH